MKFYNEMKLSNSFCLIDMTCKCNIGAGTCNILKAVCCGFSVMDNSHK